MTNCTITTAHCENCGSTDAEDLYSGDQGYTACCNELVAYGSQDCRNHHSEMDSEDIDAQAFEMYRSLVARKVNKAYSIVARDILGSDNHFDAVDAIDRHIARTR